MVEGEMTVENKKHSTETCHSATTSTTNSTWPNPWNKSGNLQ